GPHAADAQSPLICAGRNRFSRRDGGSVVHPRCLRYSLNVAAPRCFRSPRSARHREKVVPFGLVDGSVDMHGDSQRSDPRKAETRRGKNLPQPDPAADASPGAAAAPDLSPGLSEEDPITVPMGSPGPGVVVPGPPTPHRRKPSPDPQTLTFLRPPVQPDE